MRTFNTSDPNFIEEHYTQPRLDWAEKGEKLAHRNRYFTLWAPRQTGGSFYENMKKSTDEETEELLNQFWFLWNLTLRMIK